MPMPDWFDPSMLFGGQGAGGFNPMMQNPGAPAPAMPPGLLGPQTAGAPAGNTLTPQQQDQLLAQARASAAAIRPPMPNPNAPPLPGSMMAPRPGGLPYGAPQGGQMLNPAQAMPGIAGQLGGQGSAGMMGQMNPQMLQNMLSGLGGGLPGGANLMGSIMGGLGQQRPPLTAGPMGGGRPYF